MNITLIRDNDETATFTVIRADGTTPDLTGASTASIDLYVKNTIYDLNAAALAHYAIGTGITVQSPTSAGAVFTCEFTKDLTTNISSPVTLVFDILITDNSGRKFTAGQGSTISVVLNASR
jgi:hypothetical protein